jgi:hypothetical protein
MSDDNQKIGAKNAEIMRYSPVNEYIKIKLEVGWG